MRWYVLALILKVASFNSRAIMRIVPLILLAFFALGVEDIEPLWGPTRGPARSTDRSRSGRICRQAPVSCHGLTAMCELDLASGSITVEAAAGTLMEALVSFGRVPDVPPCLSLARLDQALATRGPPALV